MLTEGYCTRILAHNTLFLARLGFLVLLLLLLMVIVLFYQCCCYCQVKWALVMAGQWIFCCHWSNSLSVLAHASAALSFVKLWQIIPCQIFRTTYTINSCQDDGCMGGMAWFMQQSPFYHWFCQKHPPTWPANWAEWKFRQSLVTIWSKNTQQYNLLQINNWTYT